MSLIAKLEKRNKRAKSVRIREARMGILFCVMLFLFGMVLPSIYQRTVIIPPENELQVMHGEFIYKNIGRKGGKLIGLKQSSLIEFFTCRKGILYEHRCSRFRQYSELLDRQIKDMTPEEYSELLNKPGIKINSQEYAGFSGKPASIWWFEQPIYPFITQKRLARLVVSGEEKISYARTVKSVESGKRLVFFNLIIGAIMFASAICFFEFMARRIKNEC